MMEGPRLQRRGLLQDIRRGVGALYAVDELKLRRDAYTLTAVGRFQQAFARASIGVDWLVPARHDPAIDIPDSPRHPLSVIAQ
jgi:hypothetical protein